MLSTSSVAAPPEVYLNTGKGTQEGLFTFQTDIYFVSLSPPGMNLLLP